MRILMWELYDIPKYQLISLSVVKVCCNESNGFVLYLFFYMTPKNQKV
jgi:hypothetical protein